MALKGKRADLGPQAESWVGEVEQQLADARADIDTLIRQLEILQKRA